MKSLPGTKSGICQYLLEAQALELSQLALALQGGNCILAQTVHYYRVWGIFEMTEWIPKQMCLHLALRTLMLTSLLFNSHMSSKISSLFQHSLYPPGSTPFI